MHICWQTIHKMEDRKDVIVMCGISGMVGLDTETYLKTVTEYKPLD